MKESFSSLIFPKVMSLAGKKNKKGKEKKESFITDIP